MGIDRNETVSTAVHNNQWHVRHCRGQQFKDVLDRIRLLSPPVPQADDDILLWRHDTDCYKDCFSAKATWNQIGISHPQLPWTRFVWFSQGIPCHSFITWLTFRERLSTGARTRAWGITQHCILCGERDETRDHLFFACLFSYTVWLGVCGNLLASTITPDCVTRLHGL